MNSTFYRLASPKAVARWLEQTPDDFVFAPKMSRYHTHIKRLTEMDVTVRRFYEAIKPLAESPKMGPVLWQLPPNFQRDDERLLSALSSLPPGRHCFEFRHDSWFAEEVYDLLRGHDVALVIGDHPDRPFQPHEFTAGWTFIRFHYGRRGRGGNYSRSELDEWGARIRDWARERDVFAFFNNDWKGFAIDNALYLKKVVLERPI